jgi:membrane-associated protease RseP (regulator of RpoE activity)
MDPLLAIGYIALIYLVVYLIAQRIGFDRLEARGIEASTPLFILIKTERINSFLTRMGKKVPRVFFNIGIGAAFFGMIIGFWMFFTNLMNFFFAPEAAGGIVPIIPGVTIQGLTIVYMLIGLAITLITHEFAHGIACGKDNIGIKSSGLLFFFVLFGGFVEPDEDELLNKASTHDRLRMLSAGSYMNFIVGGIFFLIILNFGSLMSIGFNPPSGAFIYDIQGDSPADGVIQIGDVIIGLNDTEIDQWNDVHTYMLTTQNTSSLTVHTTRGSFPLTLAPSEANSSRGYIGIFGADYWEPKEGWEWIPGGPMYAFHMQLTLSWTFMILISVALFNLLPIPALDGDRILSNGLSLVTKNERLIRRIMWIARISSLLIIFLSIGLTLATGKALF